MKKETEYMNKTDLIKHLSEISKVDINDCEKVINVFGNVLEEEFESTNLFSILYNILSDSQLKGVQGKVNYQKPCVPFFREYVS
ncbi:MAG: hypothetical protein E6767_06545 [Dysgonomonas sp.]|nr:hypothetical protein [Dysgonomonas sp.]